MTARFVSLNNNKKEQKPQGKERGKKTGVDMEVFCWDIGGDVDRSGEQLKAYHPAVQYVLK